MAQVWVIRWWNSIATLVCWILVGECFTADVDSAACHGQQQSSPAPFENTWNHQAVPVLGGTKKPQIFLVLGVTMTFPIYIYISTPCDFSQSHRSSLAICKTKHPAEPPWQLQHVRFWWTGGRWGGAFDNSMFVWRCKMSGSTPGVNVYITNWKGPSCFMGKVTTKS